MKLSNIAVIFTIIVMPIILILSYYISLQIDTTNMQTSYNEKQLTATKEAIEAFEINTVEWNEAYSETADSKRRDIMASINTFTTSFANSLGIGGTSKQDILSYIPAIACTLYDGYYIYSPADTKSIIRDENGVAVFMTEDLKNKATLVGYSYKDEDKGKLLYEYDNNKVGSLEGTYNGTSFTFNSSDAVSTYEHILKPFSTYSARYVNGNTDITVNYTLDNYITIYGTVKDQGYVIKSGYLISEDNQPSKENLSENIAWTWKSNELNYTIGDYPYIYAEDNTKVYFEGNIPFQVSSIGVRANLESTISRVSDLKYKKLIQSGATYYQALNSFDIDGDEEIQETTDIVAGKWYKIKGDVNSKTDEITYSLQEDVSVINYYSESNEFTQWVKTNLSDITIGDMQGVEETSLYGNPTDKIFDFNIDPESEDSIISTHKREIIKQTLISNLNQAITSYSRNTEGEYQLPVLTETDWNHILRNVSIVTFVQNIPIGMKYYNNYAIATSTSNKEYVNPDEIYLSNISAGNTDEYYHSKYCIKLASENIIGYRNIDYVVKTYQREEDGIKSTKYYYKHSNIANQECYYCLVQRNLYTKITEEAYIKAHEKAYNTALARERYVSHKFR